MARLNPCPSCRDAFLSACLAVAPRRSLEKAQGLKPGFLLGLYGPTESRALIQSIRAVALGKLDPCRSKLAS